MKPEIKNGKVLFVLNILFCFRVLDFINIMTYDFHGAFEDYVGHHTLLYSSEVDALYNNSDWNIVSPLEMVLFKSIALFYLYHFI